MSSIILRSTSKVPGVTQRINRLSQREASFFKLPSFVIIAAALSICLREVLYSHIKSPLKIPIYTRTPPAWNFASCALTSLAISRPFVALFQMPGFTIPHFFILP